MHSHTVMVRDRLSRPQFADDLDTFEQSCLTLLLRNPGVGGDVLVQQLSATERDPEAARKHLDKGGCRLGDDRRVISLSRRIDNAKRQRARLHRSAEPAPRESALSLSLTPRMKVVRAHRRTEPRTMCECYQR